MGGVSCNGISVVGHAFFAGLHGLICKPTPFSPIAVVRPRAARAVAHRMAAAPMCERLEMTERIEAADGADGCCPIPRAQAMWHKEDSWKLLDRLQMPLRKRGLLPRNRATSGTTELSPNGVFATSVPRRAPMDPIRRNILATGAAPTAMAAASRVFAQQAGQGGAATLVIRGGIVHSVDNPRGEARDIVIEGDTIADIVAPGSVTNVDAEILDAARRLVVPGRINAQQQVGREVFRSQASEHRLPAPPQGMAGQ
jgi:hypothetical protein